MCVLSLPVLVLSSHLFPLGCPVVRDTAEGRDCAGNRRRRAVPAGQRPQIPRVQEQPDALHAQRSAGNCQLLREAASLTGFTFTYSTVPT